jgi:hypothetical protein
MGLKENVDHRGPFAEPEAAEYRNVSVEATDEAKAERATEPYHG